MSLSVPLRRRATLRAWLVFASALLVLWAGSAYTPWAADIAPRLWLYDTVFYLGFAVGGWALAEALRRVLRRERGISAWIALLLAATCGALVAADSRSERLLRWKLRASAAALERAADAGTGAPRRRVAHFIIDGASLPCRSGERWLWVGRPHGAGTGTSLALVHGAGAVPAAPAGDAFRFLRLGGGWWMAYQHAARHARTAAWPVGLRTACTAGRELSSHRRGLAFVEAGWREHRPGRSP